MASRRDFSRALKEMGKNVSKAAKKAFVEGAELIVEDMKERIHSVSGDLAASSHAIVQKDRTKIKIVADATNEKGVAYGPYVEFWPGREHPFMYPAMESKGPVVKQNVAEAIREELKKNAAK